MNFWYCVGEFDCLLQNNWPNFLANYFGRGNET